MTAGDDGADGADIVLNAPLVRALMWGAQLPRVSDLAAIIGVNASNLSRALRGESQPSVRMLDGMIRFWPLVPYDRLIVRRRNLSDPALGLTPAHVASVTPADAETAPPD